MPLYQGELMETRITRPPALSLESGRQIAMRLARAATALHRDGISHRDIKPDNVILESDGGLKLIDLGSYAYPDWKTFRQRSARYRGLRAPEMLTGEPGNEAPIFTRWASRCFARSPARSLMATPTPQAMAGAPGRRNCARCDQICPHGCRTRSRGLAIDPSKRFRDMSEFALELESGPERAPAIPRRPLTLFERAPIQFWRGLAALLAVALVISLLRH